MELRKTRLKVEEHGPELVLVCRRVAQIEVVELLLKYRQEFNWENIW